MGEGFKSKLSVGLSQIIENSKTRGLTLCGLAPLRAAAEAEPSELGSWFVLKDSVASSRLSVLR